MLLIPCSEDQGHVTKAQIPPNQEWEEASGSCELQCFVCIGRVRGWRLRETPHDNLFEAAHLCRLAHAACAFRGQKHRHDAKVLPEKQPSYIRISHYSMQFTIFMSMRRLRRNGLHAHSAVDDENPWLLGPIV
jgi:hypothetical protein